MLKSLITYLNLKLDLLNYFDLTRCLVELKEDSEGTRQPAEYISNGDYDVINWDEFNGVSYWRLRDEITSDRTEERKYKAGSRNNIETTVPLKLVFAVPRTKLTEDDAYSFDRIRQTMLKQFAIDDDVIKTTLQAESVRINVVTANSDAKDVWEDETGGTGTFEPKYETVFGSIDIDVVIISKHSCLPTECDDVESDILRSFDWCGNTAVTVGRLTPAQQTCISDFLCSCADGTIEINGTEVTTVASGATVDIPVNLDGVPSGSWDGDSWEVTSNPCADATVQLNGVDMADIASGDTENIQVRQSSGATLVGSKQGQYWRIDDSEISINGSPVADVKAEDSLDIDVTQDGSPVGSWNGSAWIVPRCPAGGSIEVTVSDSSPNIGDTITITATPSDFTPDSYLFFAYNDTTNELVFIAEQASNSFDWTVPLIDVGNYTIYVLGVENGTPDVTAFGTVDISVSSSFLLDTPQRTGANFAFAFFRLRANYTDPIAIVRRSSDNSQKAFYLDSNGVLSLSSEDGAGTTLGDWVGGGSGYLVTGYSQDTSGVTFTASNAADQMRIIIGGSLVSINGAVAMVGNRENYTISTSLTVNSAFIVAKNDGFNAANNVFAGNSQGFYFGGSFSGIDGIGMADGVSSLQTNVEDLNPHLASFLTDTGIYVDGSLGVSGTINDLTITRVAAREDNTSIGIDGKIACIVSYSTDKTADRAAIEANIDSNFTTSLLP
jgi:hypothetical protein